MKKIKKVITYLLASIIIASSLNPILALADSDQFSLSDAEIQVIGGSVVSGFVNNTNESFRLTATIAGDVSGVLAAELLIDGSACNPSIMATKTSDNGFEFLSSTVNNDGLKSLLKQNTVSEKHTFSIRFDLDNGENKFINLESLNIVADYKSPVGLLDFEIIEGVNHKDGWLNIGDKIAFSLDTTDDISPIYKLIPEAKFYGEDLVWNFDNLTSKYQATYILTSSSKISVPVVFDNFYIYDEAGNRGEAPSAKNLGSTKIDVNKPGYEILSPLEKSYYNKLDIEFSYKLSGSTTLKGLELKDENGTISPIELPCELIKLSKDGLYILIATFETEGGNIESREIEFEADTTMPFIILNDMLNGREVTAGEDVSIGGTSEMNSRIWVSQSLVGGTILAETVSDDIGRWSLIISTKDLSVGEYEFWIFSEDRALNIANMSIGKLVIKAVKTSDIAPAAISEATQSSVKMALANNEQKNVASDIPSKVVNLQEGTEDISKSGSIVSSNDEVDQSINWSVWLLSLAVLVLISAFLSAGYYGWGVLARNDGNITGRVKSETASANRQKKASVSKSRAPVDTSGNKIGDIKAKDNSTKESDKSDNGNHSARW